MSANAPGLCGSSLVQQFPILTSALYRKGEVDEVIRSKLQLIGGCNTSVGCFEMQRRKKCESRSPHHLLKILILERFLLGNVLADKRSCDYHTVRTEPVMRFAVAVTEKK